MQNQRAATHPAAVVYKKELVARPLHQGKVMINVKVQYPHVSVPRSPHAAESINAYYVTEAQKFYHRATGELYNSALALYEDSRVHNFPFREYEAIQKYEVTYNEGILLSTYYDQYEYTGGAHGNTTRTGATFETRSGTRLALSTFFSNGYYNSIIYESIIESIGNSIKNGESNYFDDYARNVFKYYDENNYYLTDKGFAIFFPLYTIAPYSTGIPVFIVPYAKFGRSLNSSLFTVDAKAR